jgi:hypothetical protein
VIVGFGREGWGRGRDGNGDWDWDRGGCDMGCGGESPDVGKHGGWQQGGCSRGRSRSGLESGVGCGMGWWCITRRTRSATTTFPSSFSMARVVRVHVCII